jgi:hypothetical protein
MVSLDAEEIVAFAIEIAIASVTPLGSAMRSLAAVVLLLTTCLHTLGSEPAERGLLPTTPQQHSPWSPLDSGLPPKAVTAIQLLFDQGLADPRGCDYRAIEVQTGIDLKSQTHGWVLPGLEPQRFAVCWNGLVYPVASVGAPADLRKDVEAMVEKDKKTWGVYPGYRREVRGKWPTEEWITVSDDTIRPLGITLLLRLGRPRLAKQIWDQWFALSDSEKDDPYLLFAREWTDSLYSRALYAHLRGDDTLALASCRKLAPLLPMVEAAGARRGLAPDNDRSF